MNRNLFKKFIQKHTIKAPNIILKQKQVYVFPTKQGFVFLFFCLVLIVMAINFQNALIYVLVFWLIGIGCTSIILTWRNLIGLRVTTERSVDVFAGDIARFTIISEGANRSHFGIRFSIQESSSVIDVLKGERRASILYITSDKRGYLILPTVKIETTYPLGLIRAWSYADLEQQILCYPKPLHCIAPNNSSQQSKDETEENSDINQHVFGVDDFIGMEQYEKGNSLRHIDWNAYAKRNELYIKKFGTESSSSFWFSYDDYVDRREDILSKICFLVLQAYEEGKVFGVNLQGKRIEPNSGELHLKACLQLLATH